jgi:RNA-directed DNA polymerase
MLDWLLKLFGLRRGHNLAELARRLDLPIESIQGISPSYREFEIAKRSGGVRRIAAPVDELKNIQRRMLHRLFARLRVHDAATGFQRGKSFVTNACHHKGRAAVISLDIQNFFPSISARRVEYYFRAIGWSRKAARLIVKLVTWQGRLPQGAPTSPRISNLVNYRMDNRLAHLAASYNATYTRYADDITISVGGDQVDLHDLVRGAIAIVRSEGYKPHLRKKFDVRRRHQRQMVTGLVVNERVNLPRGTRRWLRAVEHRAKKWGEARDISALLTSDRQSAIKRPTLTAEQLQGWRSLQQMIERQRESGKA